MLHNKFEICQRFILAVRIRSFKGARATIAREIERMRERLGNEARKRSEKETEKNKTVEFALRRKKKRKLFARCIRFTWRTRHHWGVHTLEQFCGSVRHGNRDEKEKRLDMDRREKHEDQKEGTE